ncbi:MAG TPA: FecR family protein [Kofleriaceae bacterium]|nr:FecR family protein [Kofleriaceae bacterium]
MSAHVAPHRWADLWAGRVDDEERREMELHAAACKACRRVRHRITRASDSFANIRSLALPDVPWDEVRARVHWSVSTERRAALRQRKPAYGWIAGALVAGVGLALVTGAPLVTDPAAPAPAAAPVAMPARVAPPAAEPAALVGLVSRAAGDVMVDGVRPADLFEKQLGRGNLIATGDGRVDVQFGDKSAFALGANSTVELRRFDAETIELAVDGTLDVTVAPRAAGQRFIVHAGDHAIEVRGTQFRVVHEAGRDPGKPGATTVACRHGLVTVSDPGGKVEVGDSHRVKVASGRSVASEHVVTLSSDELTGLAQATPLTLPIWDALAHSSAPLEIATSGRRDVRLDGIELGLAPLRVRVMPGRHTVEAADGAGRFRRAGWVDVAAAPTGSRLEVPAEPPVAGAIAERDRELRAHLDHPRLARCMRSIAKAGLTGSYVQIELAVDAQGAVSFLNVVDSDLPSATASCVREVLADVHFAAGPAATWRDRIDL